MQIYAHYLQFIRVKFTKITNLKHIKREKEMPEYLVLMKLNPGKIVDTLGDIRKIEANPVSDVDLCYNMNIFGAWDVGIWINAENSSEVLEFVQKKVKNLNGVTDVYTIPTVPYRKPKPNKTVATLTPMIPL
jgi:hypothetical protein